MFAIRSITYKTTLEFMKINKKLQIFILSLINASSYFIDTIETPHLRCIGERKQKITCGKTSLVKKRGYKIIFYTLKINQIPTQSNRCSEEAQTAGGKNQTTQSGAKRTEGDRHDLWGYMIY